MTPAEIAKKLTPAQVRALRDPSGCSWQSYRSAEIFEHRHSVCLLGKFPDPKLTDLGRAVLAELDAAK
jgi:hypothetical protein